MEMPNTATLGEVKQKLADNWEMGIVCPACSQYVKLYKRKITSSMAYALILLYRYFEKNPQAEYVHMNDYLNSIEGLPYPVKSGDNTKMQYWKLIEKMDATREDGSNRVGYWKITDLGKDFVRGLVTMRTHALLFNSKCYGFKGVDITIQEALSDKFNYNELMGK